MEDNQAVAPVLQSGASAEAVPVATPTLQAGGQETNLSRESQVEDKDLPGKSGVEECEAETIKGENSNSRLTLEKTTLESLYENIKSFFAPVFGSLREVGSGMDQLVTFLEDILGSLEAFFQKPATIWDITWESVLELVGTARKKVLDFFVFKNNAFTILFRIWYELYNVVKDSLLDLQHIHNYAVPPIEGVQDVYNISAIKKTTSLRYLCLYMNINLAQRLFCHASEFLMHVMHYFRDPLPSISDTHTGTMPKESFPSTSSGVSTMTDPGASDLTEQPNAVQVDEADLLE